MVFIETAVGLSVLYYTLMGGAVIISACVIYISSIMRKIKKLIKDDEIKILEENSKNKDVKKFKKSYSDSSVKLYNRYY